MTKTVSVLNAETCYQKMFDSGDLNICNLCEKYFVNLYLS